MFTHSASDIDIALHLHEDVLERYASRRLEKERTPHQVQQMKHAVSVDSNALAKLFGTAEPHKGSCETENIARSEAGDDSAPPQADQRAENLRQVLLNIKSRRAKA